MPIDTNGLGAIPAIYAQAYQGGNGKRYLVLTNKGSNAVPVQIFEDGIVLTNQLVEAFVTGTDPSLTNAPPPNSAVQIQNTTVTNPITVPEYSVVRLEWTVFQVPRPVLRVISSNLTHTLQWIGLTNVVYNVQSTTNLLGTWATLGKVSSSQTNFTFTDPNSGSLRFYRLLVP